MFSVGVEPSSCIDANLGDDLGEEDVGLRLAHSAGPQPRGNSIVVYHWNRARPAQSLRLTEECWKLFNGIRYSMSILVRHDKFLLLRGKLRKSGN